MREINERMGLNVLDQYHEDNYSSSSFLSGTHSMVRNIIKKLMTQVGSLFLRIPIVRRFVIACLANRGNDPTLFQTIVTIARKRERPEHYFYFTDATKPYVEKSIQLIYRESLDTIFFGGAV